MNGCAAQLNIAEMFKGIDRQWIRIFTSQELMPLLSKVLNNIDITDLTPTVNNIFNFARYTPYDKVKIVILGQDPYPKKGDAHGLSFSSHADKPPASLRNIYNCLSERKMIDEYPKTSDLTYWASQGVLLLNASLTTRCTVANAHVGLWKDFTDALIRYISRDLTGIIFMLWGKFAQTKKPLIPDDCHIYEWLHPSPLAQARASADKKFINCDHFDRANNQLVDQGLTPIDWNPVPTHVIFTDGSCTGIGRGIFSRAGYSTYFAEGPYADTVKYGKVAPAILNGVVTYGTNNRGEGLGIIVGLDEIIRIGIKCNTTIVTDSMFWKNMIENFLPSWEKKGVSFKLRLNHDLTIRIHEAVKMARSLGDVNIIHIKSHGKDPDARPDHIKGNDIADQYAALGRELPDYTMVTCTI